MSQHGDPHRTAALVEAAARQAKCSFAVAGGLAPHLRPGDVILWTDVIGDDRRWRAHRSIAVTRWPGWLRSCRAVAGPVLGARDILATRGGQDARLAEERPGRAGGRPSKAPSSRAPPRPPAVRSLVLRTVADPLKPPPTAP